MTNWSTPLHTSAKYGHLSVMEFLFKVGADLKTKDRMARSTLHVSAQNGHLGVVKFLVEHKIEINGKDMRKANLCLKRPLFIILLKMVI